MGGPEAGISSGDSSIDRVFLNFFGLFDFQIFTFGLLVLLKFFFYRNLI